jgi:glycosyltransferase involved in cell wall biosynthesis
MTVASTETTATVADDDSLSAEPEVRLLFLCMGDPEGERAFSGSARSLSRALERLGCMFHKANVAPGIIDTFAPGNLWLRTARRFDRKGLIQRYVWSGPGIARTSRRARRIAAAHPGYNACFVYGTNITPPFDVPTYTYMDATATQVIQGGQWATDTFSERQTQWILEHQRRLYERCTAIFPRTAWTASSLRDDFGIPEEKLCVAGAGPNVAVEPLPHGPYDRKTILFVGRQWELKRGPLIVEAFKRTRKVMPDARLIIVGCRPKVDVPGVEIVGLIKKDAAGGQGRLLKLYSEASVFCIMSCFEAFGISGVEAQNSYVPCIVPNGFSFPETVIDGVTGRLVPEYDPDVLSRIFVEMLSDPARLEAMGKAGHEHVRAKYTWDAAARRILARIREDLRKQGQGARG